MRQARVKRKTKETDIELEVRLDGKGTFEGDVPSGFFSHMLESLAKHSGVSLFIKAKGDVHVDLHHTVEDIGIVLGRALDQAFGDRAGIVRFGHAVVPMDEALAMAAVDVSGRGGFYIEGGIPAEKVGDLPVELVEEFFTALSREAKLTLHVRILAGKNSHHMLEAIFKAVARAFKQAFEVKGEDIPSTKGVL